MITCWGFLIVFQCEQALTPPVIVCPAVAAWSRPYQAELADELGRLPSKSATLRAMREHLQLRDRARKCRQSRG